jgi:hypothetical protein
VIDALDVWTGGACTSCPQRTLLDEAQGASVLPDPTVYDALHDFVVRIRPER